MEPVAVENVSKDVKITPPKSARKRILFSRSPKDENSDSTLGHMSPLSSSPDRYSSPPPSPQWLVETPPRKNSQFRPNRSPFGPVQITVETRKSPRLSRYDLHSNSLQPLLQNETPRKGNWKQIGLKSASVADMELVEESPMKDRSNIGLMTPFKCLAGKEKMGEETPNIKSQKLVVGESPDVYSPAAPIKILQKVRVDDESGTILKPFHTLTGLGINKPSTLSASTFYQTSRARAALFPEHVSKSKTTNLSSVGSKKRKRSLNNESGQSYNRSSIYISRNRGAKRHKRGEINAGVCHRVRKHKKKLSVYNQYPAYSVKPKITPEERVLSYLDKFEPFITDTEKLDNTVHSTHSQGIQTCSTVNDLEHSNTPSSKDKLKPVPPSSPPPDPSKKFFKTRRTLNINKSATVTVDKNIKLKVSNGKFSLDKPETKFKSCKSPKVKLPKSDSNKNNVFEPIGTEKSTTEIVQDSVHNNVELLLKKLEESPKKDNIPTLEEDMHSPNYNISAITTSTSSLAIVDDGPLPLPSPSTPQTQSFPSDRSAVERNDGLSSEDTDHAQSGFLFVDPPDNESLNQDVENENATKKYFPVFYKNVMKKKQLEDLTNVKSPRGIKRPWRPIGDDQYIIDAGQKKFGATQCKECGIVYQIGDPEDEMSHQKYHNSAHDLKYSAWKNERVVAFYGSERVLLIKPSDHKSWLNKVKDVLKKVDKDLGYADSGFSSLSNSRVYLYVIDKQVTGCLVAHPITFAYKMLNSVIEGCDCCSEESFPAKCGISRVWVAKNHRRKKIATHIIDCMRSSFIHGYVLGMDEFAFSAPTVAGKAFAEKYTGTVNYLVYT